MPNRPNWPSTVPNQSSAVHREISSPGECFWLGLLVIISSSRMDASGIEKPREDSDGSPSAVDTDSSYFEKGSKEAREGSQEKEEEGAKDYKRERILIQQDIRELVGIVKR